jgi:hypothetical protein
MPLEQIPDHIEQQLTRKQQLEEEIKALQVRELEFRTVHDLAVFVMVAEILAMKRAFLCR